MISFGRVGGKDVALYTIASLSGLKASVTPFGARLVELWVPDAQGHMADVVLGHDGAEDYLANSTYFGATCGRYANRIAGGRFMLDGESYEVAANEGPNCLHGGPQGFDKKIWAVAEAGPSHIRFLAESADGEMGFPGHLRLSVTYRFTSEGRFRIEMKADTTKPTVVNIVNHAYFNLAGHSSGEVLDHELQIFADHYTPVDAALLATGEIRAVAGTGFDFREARTLRRAMIDGGAEFEAAYDHNWCLTAEGHDGSLHLCARLSDPLSGRAMVVRTNEPGVQVYCCGQMKAAVPGKSGASYHRFAGLTFETQKFPGSPNHAHFPSARLNPGQAYDHVMELTFGA